MSVFALSVSVMNPKTGWQKLAIPHGSPPSSSILNNYRVSHFSVFDEDNANVPSSVSLLAHHVVLNFKNPLYIITCFTNSIRRCIMVFDRLCFSPTLLRTSVVISSGYLTFIIANVER